METGPDQSSYQLGRPRDNVGTRGVSVVLSRPYALIAGLVVSCPRIQRREMLSLGLHLAIIHISGQRKQWCLRMLVLPELGLVWALYLTFQLCQGLSGYPLGTSCPPGGKVGCIHFGAVFMWRRYVNWDRYSQNVIL